jgi:hypothetical protein
MPLVFVVAADWKLRSAVRAELRERGVDALGMDSPDAAGCALARRQLPDALVVEGTSDIAGDPAMEQLMSRLPTVLIASRTEKIPISSREKAKPRGAVLYRPVLVGEIVSTVLKLLHKGQAA